jgi:hypothetical protein
MSGADYGSSYRYAPYRPPVDKVGVGLGIASIAGGGAAAWGIHAVGSNVTKATAAMPRLTAAAVGADALAARAGSAVDAVREAQALLGSPALRAYADEGRSMLANVAVVGDRAFATQAEALASSISLSGKGASGVFSLGGHHVPLGFDTALRDFTYAGSYQQAVFTGKTTTYITVPTVETGHFIDFAGHANITSAANGEGLAMRHLGSFEGVALADAKHTVSSAVWKKPLLGVLAAAAVVGGAYLVWKATHPTD